MSKQWPYFYRTHPYYHQPQYYVPYPPKHLLKEGPIKVKPNNNMNNKENSSTDENEKNYKSPMSLNEILEKLFEKLNKLEEENQKLKEEIENIKPITIENINYKIQDLSVQELSGTLLVGLTGLSEAENLNKLMTENGPVKINDMDTEDFEPVNMFDHEQNNGNNNGNSNSNGNGF